MAAHPRNALGPGTRLDEYELEFVLGKPGGFGIAYRARDQFDRPVVIKEYFPNELALRETDSLSVWPKSEQDEEIFRWGMERFLDEARTLSRFDHPGIVKVLRYFERNNTGYFVMPFEDGEDLRARLSRGVMEEVELRALLNPLLDALEEVHRGGIWHRDIKPSNIYLRRKDRSPVLLDFGAARQAVSGRSKSMTSVLTPPYAPLEQYSRDSRNQGPWTDIYAVGVVAYEALSGKHPPDSADRLESDEMEPLSRVARCPCSPALIDGITAALRVRRVERPQSIAVWRAILGESGPARPVTVNTLNREVQRAVEAANVAAKAAREMAANAVAIERQARDAAKKAVVTAGAAHGVAEMAREAARKAEAGKSGYRVQNGDGWRYAGQIDGRGRRLGVGVVSFTNAQTAGHWRPDAEAGLAEMTFAEGFSYAGEVTSSKRHGLGVDTLPDGGHYAGELRNDRWEGAGVMQYADGGSCAGMFRGSQPDGAAVYRLPNGAVSAGEFTGNVATLHVLTFAAADLAREFAGQNPGHGILEMKDGRRYAGQTKNEKLHGHGGQFDAEGKLMEQGIYENGILKRSLSP